MVVVVDNDDGNRQQKTNQNKVMSERWRWQFVRGWSSKEGKPARQRAKHSHVAVAVGHLVTDSITISRFLTRSNASKPKPVTNLCFVVLHPDPTKVTMIAFH